MATRWGICSAGRISSDFAYILNALDKTEHQIVAVAARSAADAEQFAAKHHIKRAYGGYDALAQDTDIDIVYVGTIHLVHAETCVIFLRAGKHVLCEKPLAMNLKEAKETLVLAKEKNVFFMEALWTKFVPGFIQLEEELERQVVGEVQYVSVEVGCEAHQGYRQLNDPTIGGSVLLTVGGYAVLLAVSVFGGERPQKVHVSGTVTAQGVEETVSLTLHFSRNRIAHIMCSIAFNREPIAIIYGDKGKIEVPNFWGPESITTPEGTLQRPFQALEASLDFSGTSPGMHYQVVAVRECLQKGLTECPRVTHASSLIIAEVIENARQQLGVKLPH